MFYYDDVQIEIVETVFTFSLYAKDLFKEENLLKSKLLESFNDDSQPFFDIVINIKKYFDLKLFFFFLLLYQNFFWLNLNHLLIF